MLASFAGLLWAVCGAALASVQSADVGPCQNCASNKAEEEAILSTDQLRRVRIEYIKQQILQKLRLDAPPKVTRPILPEVLVNGYLLRPTEEEDEEAAENFRSRDDFYGTTQQVVIFPDNTSTHNCYTRDETRPNSCFRFQLTRDITTQSVTSAELWVYKVGDEQLSDVNHTYTVSEVIPDLSGEGFRKRVVALQDTSSSPGWLQFELGSDVEEWSNRRHMTHALEISCTGCETTLESPVALNDDQRPFIIVNTNSGRRLARRRRSVNCFEGISHCCREKFQVSFVDIGWNDWIIEPLTYDANVCKGSCLNDVSTSRYHHTTLVHRYLQSQPPQDNVTLALCCTPSRMKHLSLLYVDENNSVFKTSLPNMIVEACDCA